MIRNKKMVFTLKSGKSIVQTISEQDVNNLIEKYLSSSENCLVIKKIKNENIIEEAYINKEEIAAIQIEDV